MSDYQGNIIIKNPATPTGPSTFGRAPGMWKLSDVAYWIKQGVWPNTSIIPDQYFPYVSLLLSTTSLGNANNNLFVDSSGVLNPVSRGGNTTQGSFTPYATNWSNYFDGSGDYLTAAANAAFAFGTGDFTVEGWVFLNSLTSTYAKPIAATHYYSPGTSDRGWGFGISSSGNPIFFMFGSSGAGYVLTAPNPITTSTWTHLAVSRSGSTVRIFVNGTQVVSGTSSYNEDWTGAALKIATDEATSLSPSIGNSEVSINGYISNVRIVKGTAVYTSAFTPSATPLTAISGTSILTCQSNRFRDASSNNFTITPAGNTSVTDFGPFSPSTYAPIAYNQSDITNWSGYFDGSGDYLTVPSSTALTFGTGDLTEEAWIYMTTSSNDEITLFGIDTTGAPLFGIYQQKLYFGARNTAYDVTASVNIPLFRWVHVAVTRQSGTVTLWQNGVSVGSGTVTRNYPSGTGFVGTYTSSGAPFYQGYISNLRVVKGTAVYTGAFTPPTANLTAISGTSLLTLQNAAFTDNSTNNFVITPNGNVTVTGNSPFNTVGYWSNYFDGTDDYLGFPNNAALQMGTSDFTVEGWVFLNSYNASYGSIISTSANAIGTNGFGLIVSPAGAFRFFSFVSTTYVATGATIPLNQWTHVAATRSSGTLRLFVNGVLSATAANTDNFNGDTSGGGIGGWVSFNAGGLAGYISNLRMVKGTAVYTADFTVPTAPLTAISGTSLLTCQNGRYIDNSTNAFTITPYGNTSVQSFDPFYTSTVASNGGSMYFSSTNTGALETILSVPASNNIDIGAGDFTVECWVYLTSTQNYSRIIQFNNTWSSAGATALIYANTDVQKFAVAAFDFGVALIVADNTYVLNTWYHVAVTRVGNVFSMYVNGVKQSGTYTTSSRLWATTTPFMSIGNGPTSAGGFSPMQGYVSDVRIIRGTAIYTASFTPPTAPLTPTPATVLLVNGMNAGIYDATTINDMTTFGNAQVSTAVSKFGGSSVYFDGSGDYLLTPSNPAYALSGTSFTIEAWVYVTSSSEPYQHVVKGVGSGGNNLMYIDYSGGSNGVLSSNAGGAPASQSGVTLNTWHHVAVVRNGTSVTCYVNGVGGTPQTLNPGGSGSVALLVGYDGGTSPARYFNGYMDDLRITKGVARYTSNFTPPTQAFPVY